MQQFFHELEKSTSGRRLYDITKDIRMWVQSQLVSDGLLTLHIQHTSASLLINENYDSDVLVASFNASELKISIKRSARTPDWLSL